MPIEKIKIKNFKCFIDFVFEPNPKSNVIVGNNDTGKSTVLEAINLAVSGWYRGKYISSIISDPLFNFSVVENYLAALENDESPDIPSIEIEVFLKSEEYPSLRGNQNSEKRNTSGFMFIIEFDESYREEYDLLVQSKEITSLPTEYYKYYWKTFARDDKVTPRLIPIRSILIDSSNKQYRSGSDIYISRIIKEILEPDELVSVAQAHRKMKDSFVYDDSIIEINKKLSNHTELGDNSVGLSVELNSREAWKNSLTTYIDDIPFQNIGKGNQNILKTNLSLNNKNSVKADIILIEELENHLSFSNLNYLLNLVKSHSDAKQTIISTHSSYVANKLGLDTIHMLNGLEITKFIDLDEETYKFFKKLPGYDTLRLLLCDRAILVEGDSDELIIQRAYLDIYEKLPIHDKVDVISVGTSFERFVKIAEHQRKEIIVVTDNDGDPDRLDEKYKSYVENEVFSFKACYDSTVDTGSLEIGNQGKKFNYNTLEPKLLQVNTLELFNEIFGTEFEDINRMHTYMYNNKTDCALAIFNSSKTINYPEYILEGIKPFSEDE